MAIQIKIFEIDSWVFQISPNLSAAGASIIFELEEQGNSIILFYDKQCGSVKLYPELEIHRVNLSLTPMIPDVVRIKVWVWKQRVHEFQWIASDDSHPTLEIHWTGFLLCYLPVQGLLIDLLLKKLTPKKLPMIRALTWTEDPNGRSWLRLNSLDGGSSRKLLACWDSFICLF